MATKLKVYGIREVATAIDERAVIVRQWLFKGMRGIPEPTERLARGAVWVRDDIAPWIRSMGGKA